MPITSNRYVDITSVVGGASAVSARELKLRIYTTNELVPTGSVVNFSDVDYVLAYFGSSTAEEYLRAAYYFGFISKVATQPKNIQFARWAATDTSAQVFGSEADKLDDLKLITAGAFDIELEGVTFNVTALDFSGAATFADVATALQTRIQFTGGAMAATTVTYNAERKGFDFDTTGTADGEISFSEVAAGLLESIGWSSLAIFSNGVSAQTVTEVVTQLTEINNNYGSFLFQTDLTIDQKVEAATWNDSRNVEFQYHTNATKTTAQNHFDNLNAYSGTGVTLVDANLSEYPEMLPCSLLASQDWDKPAASANYMYQQDTRLTAVVTTTSEANTFDAIRMNYIGQTQEAGTLLEFYQRGVLMGGTQDPLAMGVYANEQWVKADLKSEFLNMFLALQQVPADETGKAFGNQYISASVAKAVFNGAISQGKELTTTEIANITQVSGDENAYLDVQGRGYWWTIEINSEVVDSVTRYTMDYTLIYAKRDSVDKVEGRHILI